MAEGKWIDGLSSEQPATEAARHVLEIRLPIVAHYLPLAAERADEDIEYVHQLRVATRRTGAALRLFRPVLPKKRFKEARNLLRTIRQAAGDARDWDVFQEMLTHSEALQGKKAESAMEFLIGYSLGQRAAAQETLTTVASASAESLTSVCDKLPGAGVEHPQEEPSRTTGELASETMSVVYQELQQGIADKPSTSDELHQLRISGKRVRYAIEVFADLLPSEVRSTLYPMIENLQEILGDVQDGHVAIRRLSTMASRLWNIRPDLAEAVFPGLNALTQEAQANISASKRSYRKWLDQWDELQSTGQLEAWTRPAA